MISAFLAAVATLSAPAAGEFPAYGSDTVRASKGHAALPAGSGTLKSAKTPSACHPDPAKGRICRHHNAQAQQLRADALVLAEVPARKAAEASR